MARREIHNELDRKNRNNHNDNYEELYKLKKVINDLVLDSGESDAEVVQARAGEETLNDRLDNMEDDTKGFSDEISRLESDVNDKLDSKANLSDLDDYSQEVSDELEAKLKEIEETIEDTVGNVEFKGAMLVLNENKNVKDSTWTTCVWGKAVYNLSGFWSSNNNKRFVIPKGVKKVKVSCSTLWPTNSDGSRRVRARKNGNYATGLFYNSMPASGTSPVGATSGVVEVKEGDYIEMEVYQSSGEDLELREDPYTWFAIEVVDYGKK